MQSGIDGKVPVFVFPNNITFYLEDQTTHKQVLTLYNPYDFTVRFNVLSTAPKKYTVVDAEGSLKSQCCIDIVVRHNAVIPANCEVTDKFRIQMLDYTTRQVLGKRDVLAILLSGEPDRSTPDREQFRQLPIPAATVPSQQQYSIVTRHDQIAAARGSSPSLLVMVIAAVCVVALLLPTEGENSAFPIQISVQMKLVTSYVLGLVTMVILKPY